MRRVVVFVCLSLAGCGGSTTPSSAPTVASAGDECPARGELAEAEEHLGACRAAHASDPSWPARDAYDAIVPRLAAHLASLSPPRAVTSEEVQALAEAIWALLDRVPLAPDVESARGRAESAAEELLTQRTLQAAPGAAIEALDAVTQIAAAADPSGGADPCAGEDLRRARARIDEQECD